MSAQFIGRKVSLVLFCLVTIILAACSGTAQSPAAPAATEASATEMPPAEAPAEQSGELSVLEWAGYEIPEMWADFGKEHPDTNVTFNFGASDPDIYGKVLAGSSEDIIHLYTPFLNFYVEEGLIQPLDVSKLKNWDKVPQGFKDSCTVDGKVYCVPWDWGYSSLLFRNLLCPVEE